MNKLFGDYFAFFLYALASQPVIFAEKHQRLIRPSALLQQPCILRAKKNSFCIFGSL